MTNHHCATPCIQDLSTPENDLLSKGFYAKTAAEEKRCPGLEVQRLEAIEDVTGADERRHKGPRRRGVYRRRSMR